MMQSSIQRLFLILSCLLFLNSVNNNCNQQSSSQCSILDMSFDKFKNYYNSKVLYPLCNVDRVCLLLFFYVFLAI